MKNLLATSFIFTILATSAWAGGATQPPPPPIPEEPRVDDPSAVGLNPQCVQIFYDMPDGGSPVSLNYSKAVVVPLENLLGHFPEWHVGKKSVNHYIKGEIERCPVNFYVGGYYNNSIPQDFLDDFVSTQKTAVWINYNIWKMSNRQLYELWGMRYQKIRALDRENLDENGEPGFYRKVKYKGKNFPKWGRYRDETQSQYDAAFETIDMAPVGAHAEENVVAWIEHSSQPSQIPYIVESRKKWFVADIPFSYIHGTDRYLVFSDVLFDILGEKEKNTPRSAFIRIEDVHPVIRPALIDAYSEFFASENVPFSISTIPLYKKVEEDGSVTEVDSFSRPEWLASMQRAGERGASFLFHGYTHQTDSYRNPDGISGVDYEFWDINRNAPMVEDSVPWVMNRLEKGFAMLDQAGLRPAAWLTPHYAASPLDYAILGQVFDWNVGRVLYQSDVKIKQKTTLPKDLSFNRAGVKGFGLREEYLADLTANISEHSQPAGQFFPYEIYGDVYGQRLLPETLGFIHDKPVSTMKQITANLENNGVLRDYWASIYIHPWIIEMDPDGLKQELRVFIETARKLGYKFVNMDTWVATKSDIRRLPSVDIP